MYHIYSINSCKKKKKHVNFTFSKMSKCTPVYTCTLNHLTYKLFFKKKKLKKIEPVEFPCSITHCGPVLTRIKRVMSP